MRACGREFSAADLAGIRRIAAGEPGSTRRAISRRVGEECGWRKPDGGLKDMRCRVVLWRMQREGVVRRPAPRHRSSHAARSRRRTSPAEPEPPRLTSAGDLRDLRLDWLARRGASLRWNAYVDRYHSLGYPPLPGAQLRDFARAEGRRLALFGFGAAAWKTAPRDRCIGWTAQQRAQRLPLGVNTARLLILPWIASRPLASQRLGRVARRLADDGVCRSGDRPVLIETCVEKPRFSGPCDKAANWLCLGDTQGRGKLDTAHAHALPLKSVWVFPLAKRFRQALTE